MDTRYLHPDVTELWSRKWTLYTWMHILTCTLIHQRTYKVLPLDLTENIAEQLPTLTMGRSLTPTDLNDLDEIELRTQHDVAAFLEWMRGEVDRVPGLEGEGRWIGYGLTSSDLVETAQGLRFTAMYATLSDELTGLVSELTRWSIDDTPILGRTHGQIAEPMTMRARAWHWQTLTSWAAGDLLTNTKRMRLCKLSGPTGTFAHNPPMVEVALAVGLGLQPLGAGASQIVPRSALAAWANSAAGLVQALAKIAQDIRLMNLLGEAVVPFAAGQVGSSAMAHKQNPIQAEQVAGLARLAQGYAVMLQPVDNWLERDISMSSVERVAVPDLWHVVLRAIKVVTDLLKGLELDRVAIDQQFDAAGIKPLTLEFALEAIASGESWEQAREWALSRRFTATPETGLHFMRNYPVGNDARE